MRTCSCPAPTKKPLTPLRRKWTPLSMNARPPLALLPVLEIDGQQRSCQYGLIAPSVSQVSPCGRIRITAAPRWRRLHRFAVPRAGPPAGSNISMTGVAGQSLTILAMLVETAPRHHWHVDCLCLPEAQPRVSQSDCVGQRRPRQGRTTSSIGVATRFRWFFLRAGFMSRLETGAWRGRTATSGHWPAASRFLDHMNLARSAHETGLLGIEVFARRRGSRDAVEHPSFGLGTVV